MAENPGNVFKSVKVINFDIINRECHGYPLKWFYKHWRKKKCLKTTQKKIKKNCPCLFFLHQKRWFMGLERPYDKAFERKF